jgi:thioredoxin-like negative regulator of GroEL
MRTTRSTTCRSPTERGHATVVALATLLAWGCRDKAPPPPAATAVGSAAPAPPVSAADAGVGAAWIEDDWAGAVARAKAEHKLVFVDAWATWCHTCRAMRAFVLTGDVLADASHDFVFASIDTERASNAEACAKLPITVLPTFFVVDPSVDGGAIVARWEGGASAAQLRAFFDDARAAARVGDGGAIEPWRSALVAADRAEAAGKHGEAAALYGTALAAAPPDWVRRPDVLVLRIGALARAKEHGACVELARKEHAHTGRSSSATDFATVALSCEDATARDAALEAELTREIAALTVDATAPLSADDRSDAFRLLWELRERAGDAEGAKQAARDRLALLEDAATKAGEPAIATTFDGARLETLIFLGRASDAIPLFTGREKELPGDYNGPFRLAKALFAADRAAEALAATDRALALAYGARKGQIYGFRADVLEKLGRKAEAKSAVEAELALYRGLPPGQRHEAVEKAVAARLAKM